ncbi:hypothetical protein [Bacteroides congonensis]
MKKINRLFMVAFIAGGILPASCISEGACPEKESIYSFQVQIPSLTGSGDYEEKDAINALEAYIFNNERLKIQHITGLDMNQEGIIRLTLNAGTDISSIYFLANYRNIPENEITTETELTGRDTSPTMVSPDNYFMTAIYKPSTTRNVQGRLSFTRSASRIDLDTGNNALLEVDSITISNVADRTYLFPHAGRSTPVNTGYISHTKRFVPSPVKKAGEIQKGIFYVYENGTKTADISVYGRYNGAKHQINLTLPDISRNVLYTIVLQPVGQTINGTIKIEDWKDGNDIITGNGHTETIVY